MEKEKVKSVKSNTIHQSVESLINSFKEIKLTTNRMDQKQIDDLLARAIKQNNEQFQKLLLDHECRNQQRITELENLLSTNGISSTVTEFKTQTIDPSITCSETLDVIKSLPEFNGEQTAYVSWREAAQNSMVLYTIGSSKYFAALTIFRNKITKNANDILTNHGTVLNFEAIIARLDFAYADKRPVHIIEQELSVLRQGSSSLIDFYNQVNQKLTLLTNKTIMTHGSNSPITNELNNINRRNALRVFITGLNGQLSNILFSLNPQDLPNALAKAQELESNNVRSSFALQFSSHRGDNKANHNNNTLRFPKNTHNNNDSHQQIPQQRQQGDYRQLPQRFEPMVLGSSANRPITQHELQRFKQIHQNNPNPFKTNPNNNNYNNNQSNNNNPRWQKPNYNTYNNNTRPVFKRERELSTQHSIQPPPVKNERINNLNENKEHFLEEMWDCPTYED